RRGQFSVLSSQKLDIPLDMAVLYLEASSFSGSSFSITRSIVWPRMAKICLGAPEGSKVTRDGERCHAGVGQAESAVAFSGMVCPSKGFFRTGLRRAIWATTA